MKNVQIDPNKFSVEFDENDEEGDEIGDFRSRLVVKRDGVQIREHYDGGEPEDNYYFRDWSWIYAAIEEAYRFGFEDGVNSVNEHGN